MTDGNGAALRSPFEPVFRRGGDSVPPAFVDQFLLSPEDGSEVTLSGALEVIQHPRWLAPLFWLLERTGILVAGRGAAIPVTMRVSAARDARGNPRQHWDRDFHFARLRTFNTVLVWDDRHQDVGDWVGHGGWVYLVWTARFVPPGRFTLDTRACALPAFGFLCWLPRWLWSCMFGVVHCVQDADPDATDRVHLDLRIHHPWFGDVFGYRGALRVLKTARST